MEQASMDSFAAAFHDKWVAAFQCPALYCSVCDLGLIKMAVAPLFQSDMEHVSSSAVSAAASDDMSVAKLSEKHNSLHCDVLTLNSNI